MHGALVASGRLEEPFRDANEARVSCVARTLDVDVEATSSVPMLALEHLGLDLHYDDNYFSLDPGVTRTIRVTDLVEKLELGELTVRSLFGPGQVALAD